MSLYLQGNYLNTAGLEDVNGTAFKIYPNPVSDFVLIDSSENIKNVSVFNVLGEREDCKITSNRVDMSGLESGVYFLKLEFVNGTKVNRKIIKQ
ncbi:T9SS type A sorting domain-containing protein [Flavobacterium sediminis]|uniref:T9SS type A sorting domain-containing protein n=1 Tax=Flavobacterium sediminis TaxID=2201181 RepID=UPI0037441494